MLFITMTGQVIAAVFLSDSEGFLVHRVKKKNSTGEAIGGGRNHSMRVKEQKIHFMPPFLMHIDRQCYKTPETHQYAFNKYYHLWYHLSPWLHYQVLSQY